MNLGESLTSLEKRRLLRLLLVKERQLESTKIDRFVPNRAQRPFLESREKVRAFIAANKIGKTCAGVMFLWQNVKLGGRVGRVVGSLGFEQGIRKTIYPEIKKWFPPDRILKEKNNSQGICVRMVIKGNCGDSVLNFMSGEQEDRSFEGDLIDFALIDEPCRKNVYSATLRGLLVSNGPLAMTLTPISEPWIYNEIFLSDNPDIECFVGELGDACVDVGGHLSREAIESFKSKLTADEIEARVYGRFKHLVGRVYGNFSEDRHIVDKFDIPKNWPVWCSIDPHTRKPNAALWVALSPEGRFYICNEVYWKAGIEEFGILVKDLSSQYNVVCTLVDTSSETQDWNRRDTARSILARIGVETRLARKKNMKEAGMLMIKQLLEGRGSEGDGIPRLYVFNTCKRTIYEFNNYVYEDKKDPYSHGVSEVPRKINDDMMDNLNYIVVEKPRFAKPSVLEI